MKSRKEKKSKNEPTQKTKSVKSVTTEEISEAEKVNINSIYEHGDRIKTITYSKKQLNTSFHLFYAIG